MVSLGDINNNTNKKLYRAIEKEYKTNSFRLEKFDIPLPTTRNFDYNGNFFKINTSVSVIGYAYTGRVYSCRSGNSKPTSYQENRDIGEYFDYLILYSNDHIIKKVQILSYKATYGQEICSKMWLKRFTRNSIQKKLRAVKDIDIISGATISSNALIEDINKVNSILSKLLKL